LISPTRISNRVPVAIRYEILCFLCPSLIILGPGLGSVHRLNCS
jgi:hypothetical protein